MFYVFCDFQKRIDILKSIVLAFVFAPIHLEIVAYSFMLGINELNYHARDLLFNYNFFAKPLLHNIFYLFFLPIQCFVFHHIENKRDMPFTITTFVLFPLYLFRQFFVCISIMADDD